VVEELTLSDKEAIVDQEDTVKAMMKLLDIACEKQANAVLGVSAADSTRLQISKAEYEGMRKMISDVKKAVAAARKA
jgi:uncharacterized protein YbjQ (UPF0145 family)